MDFRICTACGLAMAAGASRCTRCGGTPEAADARAFVGQMFGKYELLDVIGSGGMGVVLKGRHAALGQHVAVKLLQPGLGDPAFRERFLREARLLAGLRHPNIVEVHDFDVSSGDVPYYVMDYLEGESLAGELARAPRGLPWARCAEVLRGVVPALAYAHARGVVHRDLKPDNIFVTHAAGREQVRLLDFGIARFVEDSEEAATRLTQTGLVIGTPQYFAPEQFYGYPVTLATDQYALALIVAEMLRGRPLRSGRSFSEISLEGLARAPASITAELPASTPTHVADALGRALVVDPAQRHADVAAFARALGVDADAMPSGAPAPGLATTRPTPAAQEAAATRLTIARARPRWLAWSVALLLLALAVAWWWRAPAPERPDAAGVASDSTSPVAPSAWLRLHESFAVPVDARSLITRRDDVAVLASADGWYLQPLRGGGEASRVTLPREQHLLGALEDQRLALLAADTLQAIDPLKGDVETLARLPAEFDRTGDVRIAPDARSVLVVSPARAVLYRRAGDALQVVAQWKDVGAAQAIAVSREYLAVANGARVRVWRTTDAASVLDQVFDLGAVRDLALLDAPARLAIAERGPNVHVVALDAGAAQRSVPLQGGANALAWIADAPSLLAGGDNGLAIVRDGASPIEHRAEAAIGSHALFADGNGVLLLDTATHRLNWLDYGMLPIARSYRLGTRESWAVHVDAQRQAVFVGSSDGTLYALSGGAVHPYLLHADGVTALAGDADHLASASDDRTLAIWNLPKMDVQWRSRGHAFLVNQIALVGGTLWSSSSDGTLKRWRWPTLEEEETLDVRALAATPDLDLHAFWIDATATHALVGTWNRRLVALDRIDERWVAQAVPIDSLAGYHVVELPDLHVLAVLGSEPTRVYAWDLATKTLLRVPDLGQLLFALTPDGHGSGAYAAGRGVVLHYGFSREPGGRLRVRVAAAARSELREASAADFDPASALLWLANAEGQLLAVDTKQLPQSALVEATLAPVPAAPAR